MAKVRSVQILDARPLDSDELERLDRCWRATNYLSVGQIYLLGNPLLHEPLADEHVKPRLLGHWGTTPGRSEERRVGEECVSTCRYRRSPSVRKNKTTTSREPKALIPK